MEYAVKIKSIAKATHIVLEIITEPEQLLFVPGQGQKFQ